MVLPRILFVDDEEEILRSIEREFHFEPLEILTATSAPEALTILAQDRVDVIVSDDRMPGMSGSELLAEVNRLYPEICKIMLTGHSNFVSAVQSINEARVYRFLLKPVSGEELIGIIHHALQEQERKGDSAALSQQDGNVCTCTVYFDEEGHVASFLWSKNTRSLLGMKSNEQLNSWEILERHLHKEDAERVVSFYKSCLSSGICTDIEFRIVLGRGLVRWISQTCEISRNSQGEPLQLLFILKDITEEKRYRNWLEEQAFQDNLTGLGNRALLYRFLEDVELSLAIMAELKELGVRLQIDDFGTGYSSLSYLRRIPAESIKVDQSFVDGMEADAEKQAIVKTIIDLAGSLGMKVVAEGVETIEQLTLLASYGCHYGQGFYFDRPLPPEEAEVRRDYSRFKKI